MKNMALALTLVLGGCNSMPWTQGSDVGEPTCAASCDAHFDQCPQIFAGFPERGAVECPAEHSNCLKACGTHRAVARSPVPSAAAPAQRSVDSTTAVPLPQAPPGPARIVSSKEARLRELKQLYDEGLVTDDVYKDRQKAILSEP